MVVGVEPGLLEAAGLVAAEHAERDAGLQAERLHARGPSRGRGRTGRRRAPRARRRPCRSGSAPASLALRRGVEHVVDVQQRLGLDLRRVMGRLGAVAAVLGAAAGLHREQDADLHLAGSWCRRWTSAARKTSSRSGPWYIAATSSRVRPRSRASGRESFGHRGVRTIAAARHRADATNEWPRTGEAYRGDAKIAVQRARPAIRRPRPARGLLLAPH